MTQAANNREAVDDIKRQLHDREITYEEALEEIAPIIDKINDKAREIAKRHGVKAKIITAREVLR